MKTAQILLLLSSTALTAVSAASSCSSTWQQCGGVNWSGPTCCQAGSKCNFQSEWYSQCIPDPDYVSTTSTKTTAAATTTTSVANTKPCAYWYGQCGGQSWTGATCCTLGSSCVAQGQWYSQCIPDPLSPAGCQPIYGQCGGQQYTGPTCCQTGSQCVASNSYYSQCLPIPGILNGDGVSSAAETTTSTKTSSSKSLSSSLLTTTLSSYFSSSAFNPTSYLTSILTAPSSLSTSRVSFTYYSNSSVSLGLTSSFDVPVTQEQTSVVATSTLSTLLTTSSSTTSSLAASSSKASSVAASSSKASSKASSSTASSSTASSVPVSSDTPSLHFTTIPGGKSGTGVTTRYWDCCKPSCSWSGKADVSSPVAACNIDGTTVADVNAQSGCNGGSAYMCNNQQPFAINSTLAYGFAAASISGYGESQSCCSCMLLTFNNGPAAGKQLVTQITNTGSDLGSNHFDIAIPGGGVGIFTSGCQTQWGAPSSGWGAQYGGVSSEAQCQSLLPEPLQSGCEWRWDFLEGSDNPSVSFVEIECPAELTAITGCQRA